MKLERNLYEVVYKLPVCSLKREDCPDNLFEGYHEGEDLTIFIEASSLDHAKLSLEEHHNGRKIVLKSITPCTDKILTFGNLRGLFHDVKRKHHGRLIRICLKFEGNCGRFSCSLQLQCFSKEIRKIEGKDFLMCDFGTEEIQDQICRDIERELESSDWRIFFKENKDSQLFITESEILFGENIC